MDLDELLNPMMLRDPSNDICSRCTRLNHAILMEQFDRRIVDDRGGILESDKRRPPRDERGNLGQTLEVRTLILARRVAEMIQRSSVLSAEDVVECGAEPQRTLLDERILLTDCLHHLALEHDAKFIHIHDDAGDLRECLFCERQRALPQ